MRINALFSGTEAQWRDWELPLQTAFAIADLDVTLARESSAGSVDYIICTPAGPVKDFSVFPRLKAVMSLWAGVETLTANETLHVPLCRMVDPGLTEGMTEWVTGHVLRHHLGMDAHLHGQDGVWRNGVIPPLARDRQVGVLGLGELGQAATRTLAGLNFQVAGWSRSERRLDGIACHHGDAGLAEVLGRSEILVLLLPHTAGTDGLLEADRLALLPSGAVIINPGRGALIDDTALLAALDTGHLAHATLDVFRREPLPPDHPFWTHPRVTVTPHIASETRPETASKTIAENIARAEAGESLAHVVDRAAGY